MIPRGYQTSRPCPEHIDCPPSLPFTNYSSETIEFPVFPSRFFSGGCVGQCTSTISQEDADLCAQRQLQYCLNPNSCDNDPQDCTVYCPNGSSFTYTVPAHTFAADTCDLANEQARTYACQQANLKKICFGNLPACCCYGVPFSASVPVGGEDITPVSASITGGALPTGLSMNYSGGELHFTGTPLAAGPFVFTVTALDSNGNHADITYRFGVVEIMDAFLPDCTIGAPYSFQLTAVGPGGVGGPNFAWRIAAGSLPPGLTMSLTGLISGTATGPGVNPITFEVIDTTCAAVDRTFFKPDVQLVTRATTRVATVRGFNPFVAIPPNYQGAWNFNVTYNMGDTVSEGLVFYEALAPSGGQLPPLFPGVWKVLPPKKFKKLTYTGSAWQWGTTFITAFHPTEIAIGAEKQSLSGSAEINTAGVFISQGTKSEYLSCTDADTFPKFYTQTIDIPNVTFRGYCYGPDPDSCSDCAYPPELNNQYQVNSEDVWPTYYLDWASTGSTETTLEVHKRGADPTGPTWKGDWDVNTAYAANDYVKFEDFYYRSVVGANLGIQPDSDPASWTRQWGFEFFGVLSPLSVLLPTAGFNGIANWVKLYSAHWIDLTLSNEYTDAEALAASIPFTTNGSTAVNSPRTSGFVSTFTSVAFSLVCTNLVPLSAYRATVRFYDTATGASNLQTYNFVAGSSAYTINDSIPTPAPGHPIQVKSPSIVMI